mgnify:CR=1 FL=1
MSVGLTSLTASWANPSLPATADFIFRNMVTALDTYALLAVPLFILSGVIMAQGGISKKLFDFFCIFCRKQDSRSADSSYRYLFVLWGYFRFWSSYSSSCRSHVYSASGAAGI